MRLLVHDYSGHAFPVQLSRWLARQGHEVQHLYSAAVASPRGAVAPAADDPVGFAVAPLALDAPLAKYSPLRRAWQERRYGQLLAERIAAFAPDAVISGNCSPQIQRQAQAASKHRGVPFVYWLQDLYAEAAQRWLAERAPWAASPAGAWLRRYEAATLGKSDRVVAITEDFVTLLTARGVPADRVTVVENWAPLDEVTPGPRETAWAEAQGLAGRFLFLYAGTLGLKHNPALLAELAAQFRDDPEVVVVVASEGPGRDYLEGEKAARGLDNLVLLDWQPYEQLPQVLASAQVLLAILEPFAGVLAVPSKVLTYLCTARPILAAMPAENLATRTLQRSGGGLTVPPDDSAAWLAAARRLRDEADLRDALAAAGRTYAEHTFDIARIGRRFLELIEAARR